jgi:pimeloyl-ACP methyl ester carboxylesterase
MLLFQFPGVAERWLAQDDFRNFRAWSRHPDGDAVIARLSDPAALTASLGVYRAILPPEMLLAPPPPLPPILAPTLGVWSTGDAAVTEEAMTGSADLVAGPWRYERVDDAGHWMQLDQPEQINRLLVDFLASVDTRTPPPDAALTAGSATTAGYPATRL